MEERWFDMEMSEMSGMDAYYISPFQHNRDTDEIHSEPRDSGAAPARGDEDERIYGSRVSLERLATWHQMS